MNGEGFPRSFSSTHLNCHAWNEYSHHYLSQRMHTSLLWSWLHPNLSVGQGYFWPHYFSPVQTQAGLCDGHQPVFLPLGSKCAFIFPRMSAHHKSVQLKTFPLCTFFHCLIIQGTVTHLPLAVRSKLYLCGCGGKKIELHSHHRAQKWVQITLWNRQMNPCSSSDIIADAWAIADGTAKAAYRHFFWRKQLHPK